MPKILSLSCVYPNPAEPQCGLFVRARLRAMARRAELRVIAPVIAGRARAPIPFAEFDGGTEVLATDAKAEGERAYWGTSHARLINDFHARVAADEPFWIDADAALVSLGVLRDVYVSSGLVDAGER